MPPADAPCYVSLVASRSSVALAKAMGAANINMLNSLPSKNEQHAPQPNMHAPQLSTSGCVLTSLM
jgi:hypothetical protein